MAVVGTKNSRLYISSVAVTSATDTQAEYEALTWVRIGEVTNFGEVGPVSQLVTHDAVDNPVTEKFKGARNNGSMTLALGRDLDDAGQTLLRTAEGVDSKYAFRIDYPDQPAGSPSFPTRDYFRGLVMSFSTTLGDVNSVIGAAATIEVSSPITRVAAGSA